MASPNRFVAPFELKAVSDDGSMVFEGYAAVFNVVDRGGDVILPGAFSNDIDRFVEHGIIADQHNWERPIGKVLELHEDETGLYVKGQLVDTTAGSDTYKLMRSGVVRGLSIGYSEVASERVAGNAASAWLEKSQMLTEHEKRQIEKKGVRVLKEVQLFDISPVSVPMNPASQVVAVKGVQSADLPLGPRDMSWDADMAEARVRRWAGAEDAPNERYARAFFWVDDAAPDKFGSYKLQFADVVGEELVAVPRAIFAVAAVIQGGRGGVDIPESDMSELRTVLEEWYERMAREFDDDAIVAPWKKTASGADEEKAEGEVAAAELLAVIEESADRLLTAVRQLTDAISQVAVSPAGSEQPDEVKAVRIPAAVINAIRRVT